MAKPNRRVSPRGLSREEAADYVGIGATLFDALVTEGKLPKAIALHGRRVWDRKRIDAALDRISDDGDIAGTTKEWDTAS